jgi:hypothetical protein
VASRQPLGGVVAESLDQAGRLDQVREQERDYASRSHRSHVLKRWAHR